jgi:hypothetical protein
MAGLTVYNGPPVGYGVSTGGVQVGTGIAQPTTQVQPAGSIPASGYYTYPPATQDTGGGGGGGTTPINTGPSAAEIAAAAALAQARTQRDAALSGIQTKESQGYSDINDSFYNQVNPFINDLTDSQTSINQGRENALYSRSTSIRDLVDSIRQGINSGQVMLANNNAGSSSAAEAIAKAYSRIGSKGSSQINGQFAQDNRTLDTNQSSLDRKRDEGVRQYHDYVSTQADKIATDTQIQLDSLNADAQYAGLSPIDVATLKNQIISAGQAKLAGLDSYLNSKVGAITAENSDQASAQAEKLIQAGSAAPSKEYSFGMASPSWSGAGAAQTYSPTSVLPLFLGNKQDQNNSILAT